MDRPLLIVNGKPYHYHELEVSQPDLDRYVESLDRTDRRPVYTPTFEMRLKISTYHAPGSMRGNSLYISRHWRAESYSREVYVGNVPPIKPTHRREQLVFENAIEVGPPVISMVRRTPKDLRPGWKLSDQRICQYLEENQPIPGIVAPTAKLCYRPATHAILFTPPGSTLAAHFGYICEAHGEDLRAHLAESVPTLASSYRYRKLLAGE